MMRDRKRRPDGIGKFSDFFKVGKNGKLKEKKLEPNSAVKVKMILYLELNINKQMEVIRLFETRMC